MEFAYDWRQDVRLSARALGAAIEQWDVQPPITIIAHSLGTLVSRYYIEKLGGKNVIERVLLLGAPHYGVPFAIATLFNGPDFLPFGLLGERLREVLSTFPSAYQILPTQACVIDQNNQPIKILQDHSWLPEEQHPFLKIAQEFRRELGNKASIPTVSIFGYGMETVNEIRVHRNNQGIWEKLEFESQSNGDDRIPQGSAVLPGTEIHPVQQHHGKLFADNDVRMRLKLELMRSNP
jgi:pimeloyl-ACP methyl ester carboxylesterase